MKNLISIGYEKGEMDFSISGLVGELSLEEMGKLREMTMVAIGIAEDMFRRGNTSRNQASSQGAQKEKSAD